MTDSLIALIRQRTGGAVNVRGVRFQTLYTLTRALEAHAGGRNWTVTPEGLEDVDVRIGGTTDHVQVKTSEPRWEPHRLKGALVSIVGAARACGEDPTRTFTVLLSGPVNDGVAALVTRDRLPAGERAPLDAHLAKLLRQAGADADLAAHLAPSLRIRTLDEAALADRLARGVVEAFGAHPGGANVAVAALAAFVLDHAYLRRPFGGPQLARAFAAVAEGQVLLQAFEASGRRLIGRVDWASAATPLDFVDGRGTRPGHVAAGLDVARPRWTARIAAALAATGLCVVRAPSGQGKSALALRYALDHWDPEATMQLHACATPEAAAQVVAYLQARADLGLPTCLLVDGADWRLQHWPDVAAAARDRGVPTLVTVRVEDWRRFAAGSAADLSPADILRGESSGMTGPLADLDPVEPLLDLAEARDLLDHLRAHGRVHASVGSADRAFEQVGTPALLMEYVYLVTHGELLRHRLKEQLAALRRNRDDDHLGALRLASFAHACGVPVLAEALTGTFAADPQRVLSEIDGEYVRLDNGDVAELHRVRSEHLARLLHEGAPSPTATALRLLPIMPADRLAPFVAGALRYDGVDGTAVEAALVEAAARGPAALSAVADGLFEAGERGYAEAVRPLSLEALGQMGSPGPFFLSTLLSPAEDDAVIEEIFSGLVDLGDGIGNGAGDRFRGLRDLASTAPDVPRGADRVRRVLSPALGRLAPADLLADARSAGRLLQEAGRVGLRVSVADALRLLRPPEPDGVPDFATLSLGLYEHDPARTRRWLQDHAVAVGSAVAEHLALEERPRIIDGPAGPAVEVAFYPVVGDDAPKLNDQAVSRLQTLRELYPFAAHFRSRAVWLLPGGLVPTHDEAVKDMTPRYLRPALFRERQGLWNLLSQEPFAPVTFWDYQKAWYSLRTLALRYAEAVERAVRAAVEGRPYDVARDLSRDDVEDRLLAALRLPDGPPLHASKGLTETLKSGTRGWKTSFDNVTRQIAPFVQDRTERAARLLRVNAHDVSVRLPEMHAAFDALSDVSPDAFGARDLCDRERKVYADLAGALEFWTAPAPPTRAKSLRKALRDTHERRDGALLDRVDQALDAMGVVPALPPAVLHDGLTRALVLALPLPHPCLTEPAILAHALSAVAALGSPAPDAGGPDVVWVVFAVDGVRYGPDGMRFYAHQLYNFERDRALNWEAYAPLPLPPAVADALSPLPVRVAPVFEAWRGALSALLLCTLTEGTSAAYPRLPPWGRKWADAQRHRAVTGLESQADRVRTLAESYPLPARAPERLDALVKAFWRGEDPLSDADGLVADLEAASEQLGTAGAF